MNISNLIKRAKTNFRERKIQNTENKIKELESDLIQKQRLDEVKAKELQLKKGLGKTTKDDVKDNLLKFGKGFQRLLKQAKENQERASLAPSKSAKTITQSPIKESSKKSIFEK